MRLELTRVGLLVELANHYTTWGAFLSSAMDYIILLLFFKDGFGIKKNFEGWYAIK